MASEVSIVNNGLIRVGGTPIVSLTGTDSNSITANAIYETHRDKLLRRHTWNFATKRIKLAQSSNAPPYEFDHQYPLPSDYIRLISISDNTNGSGVIPYKMENDTTDTRVIVTSSVDVYLRYVAKITDANQMDPDFRDCLSLSLATVFALSVAQSASLSKDLKAELVSAVRAARSVDGQEDFPDQMPEGSWTSVRNGGLSGGTDATS